MDEFIVTAWRHFSGGVAHGKFQNNALVCVIFSDKNSYDIFSDFFIKLNKNKLNITFIEFQKEYAIVIYEDPKPSSFPNIGFYTDEMNLGGHYKTNKDLLKNNDVFFTYTMKEMDTPHSSETLNVDIHTEPIKVNRCQIIGKSDLPFKTKSEIKDGISTDLPYIIESSAYFSKNAT